MVDEFGLTTVDATLPLIEQQAIVRRLVVPHLDGVLMTERSAWRDVLAKELLHGRYIRDIGTERTSK